jgi:predicted amidophosphoribosyltransferase
VWHTFWTGGICPGCARPWKTTQCPACETVSPHRAWYHLPHDAPQAHDEPAELQAAS